MLEILHRRTFVNFLVAPYLRLKFIWVTILLDDFINNKLIKYCLPFSVSPYELYKREATILGVMINPFSFPNALGLIEAMGDRYLNYESLGVKTYSLSEYKDALASLKTGAIAKAVFKIGGGV